MRSDRNADTRPSYSPGVTRNRPWEPRKGDSGPLLPPSPGVTLGPLEGSGPCQGYFYLSTSLRERGVTVVTVTERGPEKSGSPIPRHPLGSSAGGYRGVTAKAPLGLSPRASRTPPDNPSRARDPWLSHLGPPLPRPAESLPMAHGPVGTPALGSQGRIPPACYFPARTTNHGSRTTTCEVGRSVGPVRVMRGWSENSQILGPRYPCSPTSRSTFDSAIC